MSYTVTAAYDRSVTAAVLIDLDAPSTDPDRADQPNRVPELVRKRLDPPMPSDGELSWIPTMLITVIATVLHMYRLGRPPGMIFDEIYYATEGQDLIHRGVEWDRRRAWSAGAP